MTNGEVTDPQEIEFRRRWYEAHLRQVEPNYEQASGWVEKYYAGASEAIAIRDALSVHGDLERFRLDLQAWSSKPDTEGFKGAAGAGFVHLLVKHTDDRAELARLLADALTAPRDRSAAAQKLDTLIEHIERIKVGSVPAPGHAPFLLSYFWGLDQDSRWPVLWPSGRQFLEFVTGRQLPKPSGERYLRYMDQARDLDDDPDRFQVVAGWWDSNKPVFFDQVLMDRCVFGMEIASSGDYGDYERAQDNGYVLSCISRYINRELIDDLSNIVGQPFKSKNPLPTWGRGSPIPRPNIWTSWGIRGSTMGLYLSVTNQGASIGIRPGWVRKGWYSEAREIFSDANVDSFRIFSMGQTNTARGGDLGLIGGHGESIYGRGYEPDQLAGLDLRAEIIEVAYAARPVIEALVDLADSNPRVTPSTNDMLVPIVKQFLQETGYPDERDVENKEIQPTFRQMLLSDNLPVAERSDLRKIWSGQKNGYGHPGVQPALHASVKNAADAEYQRILNTFDFLCWGEGDDADRIDAVLDDSSYKVRGLGESVVLKLLAICHPDRYLCVYPYRGTRGKLRMLRVLGLEEPSREASIGRRHVEANDRLRERLKPFFPDDPWGMMKFLYWYADRKDELSTPVGEPDDPIKEAAEDLLVDRRFLDDIVELLEDKGQVILYGPPGTGKTYLAQRLAKAMAPDSDYRALVQFHPSTSYEDFFEGYRPDPTADGGISYQLTHGPLARMAKHAEEHPRRRHVMVIDEINRANLPRVLGELLFLFEYRDEWVSTLYRADEEFNLPKSIWFIGTMNTADRSIALVDAALRRRFHFVPFFPDRGPTEGLLERWLGRKGQPAWVGELVAMVNSELTEKLSVDLQLGASHFMREGYLSEPGEDDQLLRRIWEYNIEPFIEDQFYGEQDRIKSFRFGRVMSRYRSSVEPDQSEDGPDEQGGMP